MSAQDNGGPAFPTDNEAQTGNDTWHFAGMTLLDYFAAKAMEASIVAGHDVPMRGYEGWREELCRQAYQFAEAMLDARSKQP